MTDNDNKPPVIPPTISGRDEILSILKSDMYECTACTRRKAHAECKRIYSHHMLPKRQAAKIASDNTISFKLPRSGKTLSVPVGWCPDSLVPSHVEYAREKGWRMYLRSLITTKGRPIPKQAHDAILPDINVRSPSYALLSDKVPDAPISEPTSTDPGLNELLARLVKLLVSAGEVEPQGPGWRVGATDDTLAQISQACEAIEKLTKTVESGIKIEHGVTNPFPTLSGMGNEIFGPIKHVLDPANPNFKVAMFVGIVVYFAWLGMHPWRMSSAPIALLSCILGAYVGYELGPSLIRWCVSFFSTKEDDEVQPQIGAESIVTLVTTFIYGQCGYKSYEKGCITDFIKSITTVPKQSDGIKYLVDFILKTMQDCANYFLDKLGKDPVTLKKSMVPELDDIHARIQKLINELRAGGDYNYDTAQVVFAIERDLSSCIVGIPMSRDYEGYRRQAQDLHVKVKDLVSKMERNNIVGNGPRREPLGIMMGGPTGVGKSTTTVPLVLAVMALVLPEEQMEKFSKNHTDCMWNYIPENPFADAYHGQFATLADEVGSQRESVGCPDPGTLGLMRMINTANFPLHMAHLDDKGNCNFRSDLVIATTNRMEFDNKSMWFPEAFSRRFKVSLLVVPKEEYCKPESLTRDLWDRRLDESLLPDAPNGIVDDINEFYPYSFLHGEKRVTGPPMSFDETVHFIAKMYSKSKVKGEKVLNYHTEIKNRYLAMRPHAQGPSFSKNPYTDERRGADTDDEDEIFMDEMDAFDEAEMKLFLAAAPWPQKFFYKAVKHINPGADTNHINRYLKEKFIDALEFVCKGLLELVKFQKNHPFLCAVIVAIPTMAIAWHFLHPIIFAQSGENRKVSKRSKRPRVSKPLSVSRVVDAGAAQAQANINQNSYDIAKKIAHTNLYTITWHGKKFGYLTFLKGRIGIMPEHFLYTIEQSIEDNGFSETDPVEFHKVGAPESGFSARFCDMEFMDDDTTRDDTTFVRFRTECHMHCDITKYIPDEGRMNIDARFDCALLRPEGNGYSLVTSDAWVVGSTVYSDYCFDNGYSYNIPTQVGDCGAILFALSHTGIPYVCGMHVSGTGKVGYSTNIRKATVDKVLSVWSQSITVPFNESPMPVAQIGEGFLVTHTVPKLRSPSKSKIVPSVLHGKWRPSVCAIGKLRSFKRDGIDIDPMALARNKYNKHRPAFNLDLLDICADTVVQDVVYASDAGRPWEPRVFEYHEAVVGVDGVDYVDSIKRGTSPGYPYVNFTKNKGKTQWFGADAEFTMDSAEALKLKQTIMFQLSEIKRGKRLDYVFSDFLKDQRMDPVKAAAGKARLVSCSAIDFLILCRMYFGDLVRWIMVNRIRNGYAIGVNNFSAEWTTIATMLQSVGTDGMIFGDYSAYDGSLSPALQYTFLKLTEAFYGDCDPVDTLVRASLFECIVNSRHVFSNDPSSESIVYEWFGGNPSGNFLTTVLNTHCNLTLIRYSLVACRLAYEGRMHLDAFDYSMCEMVSFVQKESRAIAFGDDNGISISPALQVYVTPTDFTSSLASVGFKYTSESKDGDNEFYRKLDKCTFLKRGFVWSDKLIRYLSPLDINVILEMPYWTRLSTPVDDLIATVDDAIMELAAHGPTVYNKWAPQISNASVAELRHAPKVSYSASLIKFAHQQTIYT